MMPNVESVDLRNAGQVKDKVLKYMVEKKIPLKHLQLAGSNLVSDDGWKMLFKHYGMELLSLKLSWLDCAFDDDTVAFLVDHCPNIQRLKLKKCFKIGDRGLNSLGNLQRLEHLSLDLPRETTERQLIYVADKTGSNLRTLSLERFLDASDEFLAVVKQRCQRLEKLRFTDNAICTDQGFADLFTEWVNPPLTFVDFSSNRDVDNANPDGPENPVGLASAGFTALMEHSGRHIQKLDISSCRHITHDAFSKVFDGVKRYPELKELNISFLTIMDDFIVACIFKSCPTLVKLTAFACFKVKDVLVPAGVALIGVPNAQDSIVIQGDYTGEL
jgi:DNA repair protein RAD7